MAKNDVKVGDNPKLKQKVMSDGNLALYLDYYLGRINVTDEETGEVTSKVQRKREFLHLTLIASPRTPLERQQNKDTLALAQKIRFEREQEFKESAFGYRLKKNRDINFLDYFIAYTEDYTKKDVRMVEAAFHRFRDFLRDTPEYNKFQMRITPQHITPEMVETFTEYLQSRGRGEGPKSIYARFKKVVRRATDDGLFIKNPCNGVSITIDDQQLTKEILSLEEIQRMIDCPHEKENANIRRAFIFCLYTGMRFCDVKDLTFANVDTTNRLLKFEQNKTKGHSASSGVVIPLNDGLLKLIGTPTQAENRSELVFPLPSYEMCLKSLQRWVKRAGINKHISWHCARHSFAVNILNQGANIKTVASLLGHSGLKHTEKYTRAVDDLKQKAIDSLPPLNIDF